MRTGAHVGRAFRVPPRVPNGELSLAATPNKSIAHGNRALHTLGMAPPAVALSYDPAELAREKQRSRDEDAAALASDSKSHEALIRENSFVRAGKAPIDFSRVPSIRGLGR
jgi:hypothetical protein